MGKLTKFKPIAKESQSKTNVLKKWKGHFEKVFQGTRKSKGDQKSDESFNHPPQINDATNADKTPAHDHHSRQKDKTEAAANDHLLAEQTLPWGARSDHRADIPYFAATEARAGFTTDVESPSPFPDTFETKSMKPREPILDGDVQAGSSTSFNRPVSPKASRLDAVPSVNDNLPTSETRLCGPPNNKKVVKDPLSQNVDDLKGDRSSSLAGSPTPVINILKRSKRFSCPGSLPISHERSNSESTLVNSSDRSSSIPSAVGLDFSQDLYAKDDDDDVGEGPVGFAMVALPLHSISEKLDRLERAIAELKAAKDQEIERTVEETDIAKEKQVQKVIENVVQAKDQEKQRLLEEVKEIKEREKREAIESTTAVKELERQRAVEEAQALKDEEWQVSMDFTESNHQIALAELVDERDDAIRDLQKEHQQTIEDLKNQHSRELNSVKTELGEALSEKGSLEDYSIQAVAKVAELEKGLKEKENQLKLAIGSAQVLQAEPDKTRLHQQTANQFRTEIAEMQQKLNARDASLTQANAEHQDMKQQLAKVSVEMAQFRDDAIRYENSAVEYFNKFHALLAHSPERAAAIDQHIQLKDDLLVKMKTDIAELSAALENQERAHEGEKEVLYNSMELISQESREVEGKVRRERDSRIEVYAQNEALLQDLYNQRHFSRTNFDKAVDRHHEIIQKENAELQRSISGLKHERKEVRDQVKVLKAKMFELEGEAPKSNKKIHELEEEVTRMQCEIDMLTLELEIARDDETEQVPEWRRRLQQQVLVAKDEQIADLITQLTEAIGPGLGEDHDGGDSDSDRDEEESGGGVSLVTGDEGDDSISF